MLAAHSSQDPVMRDLEQELENTMARAYDSNGQPREGFYNLTRQMENEAEEQFDVDHTILDFLVYKAISVIFEWHVSTDRYHSDLPNALVTMTVEWRSFMSQKHKGRRLSKLATFRSRLLQFVLLLTHRYHPSQTWTNEDSLQTLREKIESNSDSWHTRNGRNAAAIRCSFDFDPMDDDARLHARRARAIELDMPQDTQQWLTNPKGRPTLYTLLPSFMELTAARTSLFDEWTPGSDWFDLAGQYMLQAVIEEYVHYGEHREEVFNATFAFGTTSAQLAAEDERVVAVQSLFRKEGTNEQRPEWTSARQKYIDELLSSEGDCTFDQAQERHPYDVFETRLMSFLEYLHNDLIKPDLVQVAEGRINIDGNELSATESREMIERMKL